MNESFGRREEVLRHAGDLFAAKSIAGTTVRDIGDAADMLPGSLYHHFRSKDAIVRS
jgi:TetR/AcrR family transcriptional regulator, cholesterol catabolism regulator